MIIHNCLKLFRIDILSIGREYHALGAALDEDVAFLVHNSEVSGAQESVFGECGSGGLLILVVTNGDVGTLGLNFACDVLRVVGVYAGLDAVDGFAAGARLVFAPILVGQQRSGFGHTVTHCVVKPYLLEALLHFRVERRTTHYVAAHLSSESGVELATYLIENNTIDSRN